MLVRPVHGAPTTALYTTRRSDQGRGLVGKPQRQKDITANDGQNFGGPSLHSKTPIAGQRLQGSFRNVEKERPKRLLLLILMVVVVNVPCHYCNWPKDQTLRLEQNKTSSRP